MPLRDSQPYHTPLARKHRSGVCRHASLGRRHHRACGPAEREFLGAARSQSVVRHSQRDGGQEGKVGPRESYARTITNANPKLDAKIESVAQKKGIDVAPLNPQTEEGKSLSERMKAKRCCSALSRGMPSTRSTMTLVTNTQQAPQFPEGKQRVGEGSGGQATHRRIDDHGPSRVKTAQDIMLKIYGNRI